MLEPREVPAASIPLNGISWTTMGPLPIVQGQAPGRPNTTGPISDLVVDPLDPQTIYVASQTGGVWRSNDGGQNWSPRTDFADSLNNGAIALVSRPAGDTIYVGTEEGVLKSTDDGETFAFTGVLIDANGNILTDPLGNPLRFAGTEARPLQFSKIVVSRDPAAPNDPRRDRIFASIKAGSNDTTLASGIWRSLDGGATWQNITPMPARGFPPGPPSGEPFFAFANTLAFSDVALDIGDNPLNPGQPTVLYATVGNVTGRPAGGGTGVNESRNGVYKSDDLFAAQPTFRLLIGGSNQLPGLIPGVIRIEPSPNVPSVLFAAFSNRADLGDGFNSGLLAVFRSFDGGVNWERLQNVPEYMFPYGNYNATLLAVPRAADDPDRFNPGRQILVAAGYGDTANPSANTNVIISFDSGENWQSAAVGANGVGPYVNVHSAVVDRDGRLLVGTEGGLFRLNDSLIDGSIDPNSNWEALNGTPGLNALNIVQNGNVFPGLILNDEFILESVRTLPANIELTRRWLFTQGGLALHPLDPNRAILNAGHNHNALLFNDSYGWQPTDTPTAAPFQDQADGFGQIIWNPGFPNIVFRVTHSDVPDYIRISRDGGLTWAPLVAGLQDSGGYFVPTIAIDPSRPERIYVGTDNRIFVINDVRVPNPTWGTRIQTFPSITVGIPPLPDNVPDDPEYVTALAVTRTTGGQVIYAATTVSRAYRIFIPDIPPDPTTAAWFDFSSLIDILPIRTIPLGYREVVTQIITDPANGNNVYLVTQRFSLSSSGALTASDLGGRVWRSGSGGNSWQDITGTGQVQGLPLDTRTFALALDPRVFTDPRDDALYLGSSNGVFRLNDPANTGTFFWEQFGRALPNVQVNSLALNTTTGILAAGTYGRGVWQIQIRGLIRGLAFEDLNGNGVLDEGEAVLSGRTVQIFDAVTGAEVATTVTDFKGVYEFRSLNDGVYVARMVINGNEVQTTSSPAPINTIEITTAVGFFDETTAQFPIPESYQVIPELNFGVFRRVTISGVKFEDRDGNGVRGENDPGLAGWRIFFDENNNGQFDPGERFTLTAANGSYSFPNLGPGTYVVREEGKFGWVQTFPAARAYVVSPVSGQTTGLNGLDFGNTQVGKLSGLVFNDLNANGVRDAGEPPLAGATLFLDENFNGKFDPGERTAISDDQGNFRFLSLPPGTYRLRQVLPADGGVIITTPLPPDVTLKASEELTGFLFGNFVLGRAGGIKFEDRNGNGVRDLGDNPEPLLAGWTFQLIDAKTGSVVQTAVTGPDGRYSFTGLERGTYRIREVLQPGWAQSTPNPADFVTVSGFEQLGFDFGNFRESQISGTVFLDANGNGKLDGGELPLSGFTVQLDRGDDGTIDETRRTGIDGTFTFAGLGSGTYRVSILGRDGYRLTSPGGGSYLLTLQSNTPVGGRNFGVQSVALQVVGLDAGARPRVEAYRVRDGAKVFSEDVYGPDFRGGVRVALGYRAGAPMIVTAPGAGGGPHVRVLDPNAPSGANEIASFFAYDPAFPGGVWVATADLNGDGFDEILTGAGEGGGPHVRVFDGRTFEILFEIFPYAPGFLGGVRVAAGDVNGDGVTDVVTAAGPGGGPHLKVYSGLTGQVISEFFAYNPAFGRGIFVSTGDIDGDGRDEIITGAGVGGGPHVRVFNAAGILVREFFAFTGLSPSGVRVSAVDLNFNGRADILTTPGSGRAPELVSFDGQSLQQIRRFGVFDPSFLGGVFVG